MNRYEDAVKLLTSKGRFYIELGLDRISKILEIFNNPQDDLKYIHVAGTNGKGSVCAVIESILRTRYKTGLYTSPHIFEYTERIKFNGENIPQEVFAEYVFEICAKADEANIHLTEFEILTVMMFLYFKEKGAEIVVLETGLGGRFDATNVIKANICSVITHIDYDHTERLGNTKDKIAFEKAGIIKSGCPVVTASAMEVLKDRADELNSLFVLVSPYVSEEYKQASALKGFHQEENLALALTVIRSFFKEITDAEIIEGLKNTVHPFRFEYFPKYNLIVDASHNPNGIEALRTNLDYLYPDEKRRFIFGCLKNKDYNKMINILFCPDDEIYFYEFDYPNAAKFKDLQTACPYPCKPFDGRLKTGNNRLTIVCGSFYMLSSIFKSREELL